MKNDVIIAKIERYDLQFNDIGYCLVVAIGGQEENPTFVQVSEDVFNAYSTGDEFDANEINGVVLNEE